MFQGRKEYEIKIPWAGVESKEETGTPGGKDALSSPILSQGSGEGQGTNQEDRTQWKREEVKGPHPEVTLLTEREVNLPTLSC